jgi:hypothetical protein
MNRETSIGIAISYFVIVAILIVTGVSAGLAEEKPDWVTIVGEHIGGWDNVADIDGEINRGKITTRILLKDGRCFDYFVLLGEQQHVVLYRQCAATEWNKLN